MTVLETMQLCPEEILNLSSSTIQNLPTILDVIEYFSTLENINMRQTISINTDWLLMNEEGMYQYVSDSDNHSIARLMPLSQTPFIFFRGENSYHQKCTSSIFRSRADMPLADKWIINRVQTAEFLLAYNQHPVIRDIKNLCKVEDLGIAQHYGFATEYLDITNNKWVAAFFACCRYENDFYYPIETGYGQGFGVIYVSQSFLLPMAFAKLEKKMFPLGFQYFARPTKQFSWVYKMSQEENFDKDSNFSRILFRHDTKASKEVFEMSYQQKRFFPNDQLSMLAQQIRQKGYPLCEGAITLSQTLGVKKSKQEIQEVLHKYGFPVTSSLNPVACFDQKQIETDVEQWLTYGKYALQRRIKPIIPVCSL